MIAPGC